MLGKTQPNLFFLLSSVPKKKSMIGCWCIKSFLGFLTICAGKCMTTPFSPSPLPVSRDCPRPSRPHHLFLSTDPLVVLHALTILLSQLPHLSFQSLSLSPTPPLVLINCMLEIVLLADHLLASLFYFMSFSCRTINLRERITAQLVMNAKLRIQR